MPLSRARSVSYTHLVEDNYVVAQANEPLDENGRFTNKRVTCRHRDEFITCEPEDVYKRQHIVFLHFEP